MITDSKVQGTNVMMTKQMREKKNLLGLFGVTNLSSSVSCITSESLNPSFENLFNSEIIELQNNSE